MKRKRILASLLASAVVMTTLLSGCGKKEDAKKGTVLNLDLPAIKTLDSALATDTASFCAVNACFEGLARSNNDKPEPAGAEKWEVSEDGKVYTFTLRDQKWSDDKPVTAKDYEYAWKRILNPDTKSNYAFFIMGIKNASKYYEGKAKAEEVGITAVDDKTLKVELEQPIPYFLQLVSFPLLVPLRQDIVEPQGDKYGTDITKMVFNGPFIMSDYQKDAKLTVKKNDKYYDAANVKLDTANFMVIKEMPTKYQMLSGGELDAVKLTGEYVEKAKKDSEAGKIALLKEAAPTAFYMEYNYESKNKLLTNPKIRLALSLAINREDFVNKIYKSGYVAYGLVPMKLLCGDKEFRNEVAEPLKALVDEKKDPKALFVEGLKELGLDPDPSKHTIRYLPQDSSALERQIAEFFQNTWKQKIGVNITLDSAANFSDYLGKMHTGQFEIGMSGWGADFNDPDTFIGLFQKDNGANYGKYNSPKYEEILKKLSGETDNAKRMELFKEAEKVLLIEDAGIAPIYYQDKAYATQKRVEGLQYPSFGGRFELRWASVGEK
ncbi:peptide ABC transporter substrate-binding protein [Clostridium sp. ZS2-4]|uniref:peptide ABC transporter substrate-binding protein n=1 Tax=Clostridium sp. ZS2-4 TaxID=2987703 RepID=UPI00227B59C1|nr:peptide ABC transporter substrate-binding protein [Clostridium sp. ZS2-4]MCY6356407.1 peptide ABC transporter substrate-binding protein [Clostridium sp. ZS2-4]